MNYPLLAAFSAIMFAQFIKYPIAVFLNKPSAKLSIMTSTGGMPSSHSASVASLTTALILQYGFNSPLVAISTLFGVIIMFDSMGVRRQSGEQGIVLDAMIRHYINKNIGRNHHGPFNIDTGDDDDNPVSLEYDISNHEAYERMIIKRYLGHKPSEVIAGILTGIFVASVLWMVYRNQF